MSVFDRIEKSWKELDFDEVVFEEGSFWNWGRGGAPLKDYEWHISHYDKDMQETRYKLPAILNEMLERRYKEGMEKKLQDIRNVLRLD